MANQTLSSLVSLWEGQIKRAKKTKERDFGKTAARAWDFLGKNYEGLYIQPKPGEEPEGLMGSEENAYYKARRNLSREYVSLMLPYVHSRVPHRLAEPRRPQPPGELLEMLNAVVSPEQIQAETIRAWLLTWWLNFTPDQFNLTNEIRTALPEALVKGRAVVWHEMLEGADGPMPGTFFGSVDDLFIDPDAESLKDAAFVIRRRRASAWKLAKDWGRDPSEFPGVDTSNYSESLNDSGNGSSNDDDEDEQNGKKKALKDVVTYYEVYSRMGIGANFPNAPTNLKEQAASLEELGPFVYLVIVPGMSAPLNLPEELMELAERDEAIKVAVEWPIPFYYHKDPWPCTCLDFYPNQDNPWATSPLEGSLPLLVFIDHLYSFIMGRIRSTCRDLIITSNELESMVKKAIESMADQSVIGSDATAAELKNLIHIVKFPEVNGDYWKILAAIERAFERASGMLPLMFGSSGENQIRSAKEADIREGHVTSRPNDFADRVEEWNSRIAAKEAVATRMHVPPPYALFLEPAPEDEENPDYSNAPLSAAWAAYVNTDDPGEAASSLSYTVAAGSGRRKNRQARIADSQNLVQIMFQPFVQLATQGMPDQYNALIDMLAEIYEMPLQDMKIQRPPAPPAMPGQPPQMPPQMQ